MNVIALDECKGRILSNDEVRMVAVSFSSLEEHHTALQKSHESLRIERDELFRRAEALRKRLEDELSKQQKQEKPESFEGIFDSIFGKSSK